MPIFQRCLFKEMLLNACITFAVILLIVCITGTLSVLHKAEFLTPALFAHLVGLLIGTNLSTILPLTVLVAAVFTYGRAAADNELNTLRASGIHLMTALAPGYLFGLLATALVFHVNDVVAPALEMSKSMASDENRLKALASISELTDTVLEIDDESHLIWESVDPETGYLRNLRYKRYEDGPDVRDPVKLDVMADWAWLSYDARQGLVIVHLRDVKTHSGGNDGGESRELDFPIAPGQSAAEKKLEHHTLTELVEARYRDHEDAPKRRRVQAEFHKRIAGSFACLLFMLIGMPLAMIFRQGNRMVAFLLALLVAVVVYFPTFLLGDFLAKETDLHPVLAIWSGSGVLTLLGLGLTWVVLRR